jgi:hypothetical protein
MRRSVNQRNPKRASERLPNAPPKAHVCRRKRALFAAKRAFREENPSQNRRKPGSRASFSFRKMSDFKALRRIFLPT